MKKYVFVFVFLIILLAAGYIATPAANRAFDLPDLSDVTEYEPISSIELYDFKDRFVGYLQAKEDRKVVPLKQISPYLRRAVLATEDKDFYSHLGIDPIGIVRAFFVNLKAGKIVEGGSTITQQLVKNLLIPEKERGRTYSRKIKEILLAIELEQRVEKDKILELYLNQVYWGSRAYGAERASQRYFRKKASDLRISESAYLAGLLQAPSALSQDFKAAKSRQELVLTRMYKFGFINEKQFKKAMREKLKFRSSPGNLELYPFYFTTVLKELKTRFDIQKLKSRGYKIYTSLDPELQDRAETILNEEIKKAPNGVTQFAFAGIDVKTGQIRTIVGGVGNFWEHQWNRATSPHTIGSAFKPFVYLTGFRLGIIDTGTVIKDSKVEIDDGSGMMWVPRNFDNKYWNEISIRRALTFSRNLPAVKVARRVGVNNIIETARSCGLTSNIPPNLSISLGSCAVSPVEAAGAYATFSRGGVYIKPILIRRIEDNKGRVVEKNTPVPVRAQPHWAVSSLVSILQDVVSMGTGTLARLPDNKPVAGKTGTSDQSRDVWFIGFTPDFAGAIWGGNDHNKPIYGSYVTGGAIVARVWQKVMEQYYKDNPDIPTGEFPKLPEMKELLVDPLTGLLATQYTYKPVKRKFFPGTEPTEYSPIPKGAKRFGPLLKFLYGPFNSRNRFVEHEEFSEGFERRLRTNTLTNDEKETIKERTKKLLNINNEEGFDEENEEGLDSEEDLDENIDDQDLVAEEGEEENVDPEIDGQENVIDTPETIDQLSDGVAEDLTEESDEL